MKTKRNKANRRTMTVYNSVFKFREPYQVLFDADFAITATAQKIEVQKRLSAVLGGMVKPSMSRTPSMTLSAVLGDFLADPLPPHYLQLIAPTLFDMRFDIKVITQCSIAHLIKLASEGSQVAQDAVDLTRNICERRKCNHWKTKGSSVECIKGIIGDSENRLHYVICTQDASFRTYLRENIIGVPILYLNRSGTLLLEEEGPASELRRKRLEEEKLHVPPEELQQFESAVMGLDSNTPVQLIQRTSQSSTPNIQATLASNSQTLSAQKLENKLMKKKKRRKGGPNPLSVKKKKSSTTNKQRVRKPKSTATDTPTSTRNSLKSIKKKSKKVTLRTQESGG